MKVFAYLLFVIMLASSCGNPDVHYSDYDLLANQDKIVEHIELFDGFSMTYRSNLRGYRLYNHIQCFLPKDQNLDTSDCHPEIIERVNLITEYFDLNDFSKIAYLDRDIFKCRYVIFDTTYDRILVVMNPYECTLEFETYKKLTDKVYYMKLK